MTDELAEVLLVEDSPDDVAFFIRAFRKANMPAQLHVAADGHEALEYLFLHGSHPRLRTPARLKVIFLDLKLPKVDGIEVLRRIKGDLRTRSIPVVVVSSSREERDLVESYALGVNSYIVKPMDFDQFSESVRLLAQYWLHFNQTPEH